MKKVLVLSLILILLITGIQFYQLRSDYTVGIISNNTNLLKASVRWSAWKILTKGSIKSSSTTQVQVRDKKYRYSRYRYWCYTIDVYKYYPTYYSDPSFSQCDAICGVQDDCYYSSMSSRYGDYDRNEGNVDGDKILTIYGRKSWTIDGVGKYYSWQSYYGTIKYDANRRQIRYRYQIN